MHCTSPMCLGHESAGIVVRLGSKVAAQAAAADAKAAKIISATGQQGGAAAAEAGVIKLGDRVAMEPGETCRMCVDCRSGRYQVRITLHVVTVPISWTRTDLRAHGVCCLPAR